MQYGKEIWFVDDDRVFQFIVEKYLRSTRYENQYRLFDDGDKTLLELVKTASKGKNLPGLIFLDLNMKYIEGWETLDFLQQMAPKTQVVIITSSVSAEDREKAKGFKMVVDYITKPIDKDQLLSTIATAFGDHLEKAVS